jgi:hypothetical protein
MYYAQGHHEWLADAPVHEHRDGLYTVWKVVFDRGVVAVEHNEEGEAVRTLEEVKERYLVVDSKGKETWTNDLELVTNMVPRQYALF